MSGFGGIWSEVLSDGVSAARVALRELEPKEIPAPLNRIAAYQGGRLPPPLAARLLDEIDKNEWFRNKAAEAYKGEEGEPSHLFLVRPDGWWLDLAAIAGSADEGKEQQAAAELHTQLRQAEEKRDVATRKAAEYKKTVAELTRQVKDKAEQAKEAAERRFAAELGEVATLRDELAVAGTSLEKLRSEQKELASSYDALRSRLAKSRRTREAEVQTGSSFLPRDPVRLARMLDLQSAAMGRNTSEVAPRPSVSVDPLELQAGVRPDSSDAIRWLLELEEPVVVVVDGYNAQFHINEGDFASGGARRVLIEALKRLRTSAKHKHRVVVVYDSTLPGERVARTSLGGVEVRFADKDNIADEEIVEMTAGLDRVVVVSSDRAVRDGAESNGAVVLWSEALYSWLSRS